MSDIIKEYRNDPAINYSTLKSISKKPSEVKYRKDISEFPSVKRGDILDMMFEDKEKVFEKYQYFKGDIPTATTLQLAERVIEYCKTVGENPSNKLVLEIIEEVNSDSTIDDKDKFWANLKDTTKTTKKNGTELIKSKVDKLIEKFDNKQFWDYVNFYLDTSKILVTKEILDDVEQAYQSILNHEGTKHIFDTTTRELIYQQPIYTTYEYEVDGKFKQEEIKALVDVISIDHKNKIIFPYDFKMLTDYSVFSFPKRYLDMRYYLQGGLYTYAINKWVKIKYPGYKVLNYNFIVISTKNLSLPIIFDAFDYIVPSKVGFEINNIHYPGINQLIEDYKWHLENDLWSYRRELYENKFVIKLKL